MKKSSKLINKCIEYYYKMLEHEKIKKLKELDVNITEQILNTPIEIKKLILSSIAFIIALITITVTSYAWLVISRTPIASNLGLSVLTENDIKVAFDIDGKPDEWQKVLDFADKMNGLAPLKACTYSNENNCLFTAEYDVDGRISDTYYKLSDNLNSNVDADSSSSAKGYYILEKFWVKADSEATIALSEAAEVAEGIGGTGTYVVGLPIWDSIRNAHVNGAKGLENAVRIGLQCVETDLSGKETGNSRFIIYEPNSDDEYIKTPSIDGSDSLVDSENLIIQSTSSWADLSPALKDEVKYNLGEFKTSTELFKLTDSNMYKVTIYIWIEGNDKDCNNSVSAEVTDLLINIQIKAVNDNMNTGISRD